MKITFLHFYCFLRSYSFVSFNILYINHSNIDSNTNYGKFIDDYRLKLLKFQFKIKTDRYEYRYLFYNF